LQDYIKTYYRYYGLVPGDFISCECCGSAATDIHHIIYRSHFGKKQRERRDNIGNLMALCRECHNKAHEEVYSREYLQKIHNESL
jgi:5-methylcytosine-specific restriction endonuclease McrA